MKTTEDLEITEAPGGARTAVLRVRGRLDAATAPTLLEHCARVRSNGQNLVLNLSEISYVGSSGVGAMLVVVEQFEEQGGSVHFAALSESAKMVVDLLDLATFLKIDATEAEAVKALGA